jgi:hypothetical protein
VNWLNDAFITDVTRGTPVGDTGTATFTWTEIIPSFEISNS